MAQMGESDAIVIEKGTEDLSDENHVFKTVSQPLPFHWTFLYALVILSFISMASYLFSFQINL